MSIDLLKNLETDKYSDHKVRYRHSKYRNKINSDYLRNFIFGSEDSLVSTVGFLFGVASSGEYSSHQIILAGLVLASVEALSMGVGSYLTESEIHQLEPNKHKDNLVLDGIIMFISYFISGLLTLLPYFFFQVGTAKFISIGISLALLYLLGYLPLKNNNLGLKMLVLAGGAIMIGYVVARIFDH